jgi:hypothetical protein
VTFVTGLFGSRPPAPPQESVFVFIRLSDEDMGDGEIDDAIYALQEELTSAIASANLGEFDGDEWDGGYCQLFMYGRSADDLFSGIAKILLRSTLPLTHAVKRYGPPDEREQVVQLRSS